MLDKVVIITGASSGIGEALAYKFTGEGSKVVLAARRIDKLAEIEKRIGGQNVLVVKTDVTNENDCKNLILKAVERFGHIDVLINNAGVSMRAMFIDCDLEVLKRLMNVNFWGTVYCSKFALPYLLKTNGSLVGVVSIAGYIGLPGRTGYSASKFAVKGFLDTIRVEYLKSKLHVLIAAPGFVTSEVRERALVSDGKQQGVSPRNEGKMMSAEKCASLIYNATKKRKRELIMSFYEGKLAVFLNKWIPRFVDKVNYKMMEEEQDSPLRNSKFQIPNSKSPQ